MVPVARISKTVIAVSVPTSLNVNSLKELEALARAKPGQLNWTTATGFTDFVFAGYLHTVGLTMAKVPYKNPVRRVTDLAAGRIQVYMPAYAIVRPQVRSRQGEGARRHQSRARSGAARRSDGDRSRLSVARIRRAGGPVRTRELAEDVRAAIADDIRAVAGDPDDREKTDRDRRRSSAPATAPNSPSRSRSKRRRLRRWRNCSATSRCSNRSYNP